MSVILGQGTTKQETVNGNLTKSETIGLGSQSQLHIQPVVPTQVMGLVPVFPCCSPLNANNCYTFKMTIKGNISGQVWQATFQPPSGGVDAQAVFGNNYTITQCATQIDNAINALSPYTCMSSISGQVATFTVCVPNTSQYNNTIFSFAVCCNPGKLGGNTSLSPCTSFRGESGTGCSLTYTFLSQGQSASGCADCRQGLFKADTPADDRNWTLPVYADQFGLYNGSFYYNDTSAFLFSYPAGYNAISNGDFGIQKLVNNVWTTQSNLTDNTYGVPYSNSFSGVTCSNVNYQGYLLSWQDVIQAFGVGYYRFYVSGSITPVAPYCLASPPFCLNNFDCNQISNTVKFEAYYSGGQFGSVTNQGTTYTLCCQPSGSISNSPIAWYDSVRFYGFFGRETSEYQRDSIKYASGVVNKVRDELIHSYELRAGGDMGPSQRMPDWLNQTFSAYGLMADQLYVSDYALNNANYNKYKRFWVMADSGYSPNYTNFSRYTKVSVNFKEGQQLVYRQRCC